ncbi:GxGYxYP domain-containing protein [Mucilaginibacter sp. UYCu711]|uniref:GxGYxYP domain-containing protein n=1 Tax=Mucilaginibacter sp. UYCu711 TaxID=3156339 RepID=UPI003D1C0010
MKKPAFIVLLLTVFAVTNYALAQSVKKLPPVGMLDLEFTLQIEKGNQLAINNTWDYTHTIASLQGIVNRTTPQLYIFLVKNGSADIDRYWWNKYRAPGKWLAKRDTILYKNVVDVISAYKKQIKGAVVYDPNVQATSNVASSIAGVEDLIVVRYDTNPNSLYSQIITSGPKLPVKISLVNKDGSSLFTGKGIIPGTTRVSSGSAKNDAYLWFLEKYMKTGRVNTKYGAYYIDQQWLKNPFLANPNHHTLTNHDFFISRKGFFFDLSPWADESATDDPAQTPGTDVNTLKEMLLTAYNQNKGGYAYLGGFPPWAFKYTKHAKGTHEDVATEWEYSRIISAYNAFKDADAIGYGALANASFWQHFPLKKEYKQDWVTKAELTKKGYLNAAGKIDYKGRNFLIFYVGDYDASSWVSQTTPTLWDDPNRGKVPMMWCISPVLAERVPMAMDYRRESATPNDYFAAADNGAGYLMPGMLQAPRPLSGLPDGLDAWVAHNKPYYKQWGLTITGFIIDGQAPPLNQKGLDAYAAFSPNGIVPQKVPLTLLHGDMPVMRSDADVNEDPAKAAQIIYDRIQKRKIPFHWFRNILKSPSWYVQVVAELKKLDPNIELLTAPDFFELYRTYLKENPEAAQGKMR